MEAASFSGACNGSEQVQAYWTTTSGCGGSWVGCAQPTSSDAAGGINTAAISLNSSYTYSADGIRAVATHELGHLFSLWEQYVDDGSFACNSNVTSIMESVTLSSGVVVSVCGQIQTQPFDYNAVQQAFTMSFGTTPTPQVLWVNPISSTSIRVAFKAPKVASRTYQRTICGGAFPVTQAITAMNNDVAYADFPMTSSGTSVCAQIRAVGGSGSNGVQYGRLTTSRGDVNGAWVMVYGKTSEEAIMRNNSGSQNIPFTRITDNTSFANFPRCDLDTAIGPGGSRSCNKETFGTGVVFWWSQDHSSYDSMNVP